MRVLRRGMFYGTGTNTAAATIPSGSGQLVGRVTGWTSPGAGTLEFYRARSKAKANAAVAAATALVIKTDALGYIDGSVITTNDYVLVKSAAGTWALQKVSAVAAVSSSTVALTLAGNITCDILAPVYIVRAADIVSFVTAAETVRMQEYIWNGYEGLPVHALLTATGTCLVSGSYDDEAP